MFPLTKDHNHCSNCCRGELLTQKFDPTSHNLVCGEFCTISCNRIVKLFRCNNQYFLPPPFDVNKENDLILFKNSLSIEYIYCYTTLNKCFLLSNV